MAGPGFGNENSSEGAAQFESSPTALMRYLNGRAWNIGEKNISGDAALISAVAYVWQGRD
jgi:hypothetical protein